MKTSSILIPICTMVAATKPNLRMPSIQYSSLARHLSATSESSSCQKDMIELGLDSDLSSSLQDALDAFSSKFDTHPKDYCRSSKNSGRMEMNCFVDYKTFSSDYKSICKNLEGEYFPITLFMQCSGVELDVEMEFVNIPSCLAHECSGDEVTEALGRLLLESSADTSKTDVFDGFSCRYFLRTIDQESNLSFGALGTTSSATHVKGEANASLLIGVFGLLSYLAV